MEDEEDKCLDRPPSRSAGAGVETSLVVRGSELRVGLEARFNEVDDDV